MRYLFEYRDFRRLMFHRLPEFDEQMCTWVYTFTRRCLALGTQVKVSAVKNHSQTPGVVLFIKLGRILLGS